MTIVFDAPRSFRYLPGQFVNVSFDIEGTQVMRSYSLSSYYEEDMSPSITVKRVANGHVSRYLVEDLKTGEDIVVEGPFGNFASGLGDEINNPVVCLAGGSGIVPILPVIRHMRKYSSQQVVLIYASRDADSTLFLKELSELNERGVQITYAFSKMETSGADNIIAGRLSKLLVKKLVRKLLPDEWSAAKYFICGPEGLMGMFENALSDLGIPEDKICKEDFVGKSKAGNAISLPRKMLEVLVHYNEMTTLVEVHPGSSILEAAHKEKIPVPASCKTGTCGTCYGKVIGGAVHLERNAALTEAELSDGYILLCQAYPITEDTEVEVVR